MFIYAHPVAVATPLSGKGKTTDKEQSGIKASVDYV